ncbi:uncharacterized protein LOC127854145 [Dreissena polymorpha]|uniref:uncharacterized protein LOC127854145 n=1 Tax=Dreissena polymorpha TaxID=45954 RepID=UPI00226501D8|nr:uncharacterized protein LOC127854145 [Dreissena polymorpha]
MLDGLAFLPTQLVNEGMAHLRTLAPEALMSVVDYFDATYVTGTYRTVMSEGKMRFRAVPPRFPPSVWNVSTATINGDARTNNVCESMNCGFRQLVGHSHPSMWKVLECVQKDNAMVKADAHMHRSGQSVTRKRKKATIAHQCRLKRLCEKLENKQLRLPKFLASIGNCMRLI